MTTLRGAFLLSRVRKCFKEDLAFEQFIQNAEVVGLELWTLASLQDDDDDDDHGDDGDVDDDDDDDHGDSTSALK